MIQSNNIHKQMIRFLKYQDKFLGHDLYIDITYILLNESVMLAGAHASVCWFI